MPGPYGLPQIGCAREGRGRAAALPFSRAEVDRERVVTQSSSEPFRPAYAASSPDGEPFCGLRPKWGAPVYPCGGSGELPNFKTEEGPQALSANSNTAFA